jgi:hypothetical protein
LIRIKKSLDVDVLKTQQYDDGIGRGYNHILRDIQGDLGKQGAMLIALSRTNLVEYVIGSLHMCSVVHNLALWCQL